MAIDLTWIAASRFLAESLTPGMISQKRSVLAVHKTMTLSTPLAWRKSLMSAVIRSIWKIMYSLRQIARGKKSRQMNKKGSERLLLPAPPWCQWGHCLRDSPDLQQWTLECRLMVWVSGSSCVVAAALVKTSQAPELAPLHCPDPMKRYPNLTKKKGENNCFSELNRKAHLFQQSIWS